MGEEEQDFEYMKLHHILGPLGELLTFPCPHCGKEVFVRLQASEGGDEDDIEGWWGKTSEEIDEKQKKLQKELEEEDEV